MQFIKNSIRELRHVVWPTKEETRKYFLIVVTTLVLFGTYLFIFSTIFSESLLYLKKLVSGNPNPVVAPIEKPEIEVVPAVTGSVNESSTGNTES